MLKNLDLIILPYHIKLQAHGQIDLKTQFNI